LKNVKPQVDSEGFTGSILPDSGFVGVAVIAESILLDEKVRREQTISNTIDSAVFTTATKSESGKIEPEKPSESTYGFNFSNFDEGIAQIY